MRIAYRAHFTNLPTNQFHTFFLAEAAENARFHHVEILVQRQLGRLAVFPEVAADQLDVPRMPPVKNLLGDLPQGFVFFESPAENGGHGCLTRKDSLYRLTAYFSRLATEFNRFLSALGIPRPNNTDGWFWPELTRN